jgi:cell division protein FtsB
MLEKIKKYYKNPALKSLGDIRNLGMIAFGIIALLVTWSSVRVVQENYDLQKQISAMQQYNDVQKLANNNLSLENQYYTTNTYLELSARQHFNKALPGEQLVIVPKEIALAHTIPVVKTQTKAQAQLETMKASGSSFERNYNAWLDFLFHRQAN